MRHIVTGLFFCACINPASAEEDFDQRVIKAILAHPEVVLLAVEKLRAQEEAVREDQRRDRISAVEDQLFADEATRVVEFIDYRCGYCAQSAARLATLTPQERAAIRFMEFPILGEASTEVSEVALAVRNTAGEAAYRAFHFAVYESRGRVANRDSALALAASQGHDAAGIAAVSKGSPIRAELDRNRTLARSLGITGTPAFVSRGDVHEGLMELADLRRILSGDNLAGSILP